MPASRPHSGAREQLVGLIAPVVASAGLDLEDLTVQVVGRRSVVRLIVDGEDGVDLDVVAALSRAVSDVLDADAAITDAFGDSYLLEVSSPGVDRPLTEVRHWRRSIGRLVKVTVDNAPVTARIIAVSADSITLRVDGVPRDVAWPSLGGGRVQVEFKRVGAIDVLDTDVADTEDDDLAEEG